MSDTTQFAIWWLSLQDMDEIDHALGMLPEYIQREFRALRRRNGRGRLWVSGELEFPDIAEWPDTPLGNRLALSYGGIAIRATDASLLADMPGIVTGMDVRQLGLVR